MPFLSQNPKGSQDQVWNIYTMKCHSDLKRNEILPFVATWMDLEINIPSEVSQIEKDKYYLVSLNMCNLKK